MIKEINFMSSKERITQITSAPFSWKERDMLTAAEKYMVGTIEFPMIEYVAPCFPNLDTAIAQRISQVWRYSTAAFHLRTNAEELENVTIHQNAARIYELEAHRILGSIFSLEHEFWRAFYIRQELEETKPLIALDAIYHSTSGQEQIAYQLLQQSLKVILKSYYNSPLEKKVHFENAKRLLTDLPTDALIKWINQQLIKK